MALNDPQTITINAIAIPLNRTSSSLNRGDFSSVDRNVKETVSHQYGKRVRHLFRLDHSKVAADPFQSTLNAKYSMSVYLVADVPDVGYTVTEQKQVVDGFIAQLSASTGALITEVLGGEN